jgi:Domain of unknown function (DUF4062)
MHGRHAETSGSPGRIAGMKKRYQVFVSSTYKDLTDERAAVIQMILNLNHFPAGMEMFPAANQDQWRLIQRVIDESDYYVVVVGGRYGTMDEASGISYTEREYDYAVKTNTPVIGFLHKEPENIPAGKTDENDEARAKLTAFRKKVEGLPVQYFTSAAELGGQVAMSLMNLIDTEPRVGWVRGDAILGPDAEREILTLRAQLAEATAKSQTLVAERVQQVDPSTLADGEDKVTVPLRVYSANYNDNSSLWVKSTVSWNDILEAIGPSLIDEATEEVVEDKLELALYWGELSDEDAVEKIKNKRLAMQQRDFETIIVHFRTLGVIQSGQKKRVPSDTNKYLRLSAVGQQKLAALISVKKKSEKKSTDKSVAKKAPAKKAPAKKAT